MIFNRNSNEFIFNIVRTPLLLLSNIFVIDNNNLGFKEIILGIFFYILLGIVSVCASILISFILLLIFISVIFLFFLIFFILCYLI
ncbi:hypothetical protein H311_00955, partial [Anncaliia algerae PRA109]